MEIISGRLQFGETKQSIRGKVVEGSERIVGRYIVEEWILPCLELNPETNCFEPKEGSYSRWGATEYYPGGSRTTYFATLAEAEIFALTHP